MKKNESKLIDKIVEAAPKGLYIEKTFNPLRRGVPDLYVESNVGVLWVECKWTPALWAKPRLEICDSRSWPLQKRWLQRAKQNGIPVGVLVGIGNNEYCYWITDNDFQFKPTEHPPTRLLHVVTAKWATYLADKFNTRFYY